MTTSGLSETGNAIGIFGGTLTDNAGGGTFDLLNATHPHRARSPPGQTITVLANASGGATTTLPGT